MYIYSNLKRKIGDPLKKMMNYVTFTIHLSFGILMLFYCIFFILLFNMCPKCVRDYLYEKMLDNNRRNRLNIEFQEIHPNTNIIDEYIFNDMQKSNILQNIIPPVA